MPGETLVVSSPRLQLVLTRKDPGPKLRSCLKDDVEVIDEYGLSLTALLPTLVDITEKSIRLH